MNWEDKSSDEWRLPVATPSPGPAKRDRPLPQRGEGKND
jgi:hypothetical protein